MRRFSITISLLLTCLVPGVGLQGQGVEPPRIKKPANFVSAEGWGSKPDAIGDERRHTPKFITLHHAGVLWTTDRDPVEFVRNMQAWGKRRPQIEQPPRNTYWPDLPYHFMIAPDGRIFEGRPVEFQPESNTKYDLDGHIGVELMGNFEQQRPSQEQVESAVALVAWLVDKHDIAVKDISTHQRVAKGQTTCPGRDFARYFEGKEPEFRKWVEQTLEGETRRILSAQYVFLWELLERGYATSDSMVASMKLSPTVSVRELEIVPQQFANLGFCKRDDALSPTWSRFAEYPITGWILNEDMEEQVNRWLDENPLNEAFLLLGFRQPDYVINSLPEEARFGGAEAPAGYGQAVRLDGQSNSD